MLRRLRLLPGCLKKGPRISATTTTFLLKLTTNINNVGIHPNRFLSNFPSAPSISSVSNITLNEFEKQSEQTLEHLTLSFEELAEVYKTVEDVMYSDGVLTLVFADSMGTYVINKQTPNRQLWLSSPVSGPKRYNFDPSTCLWVCTHGKEDIFSLLSVEISLLLKSDIHFENNILEDEIEHK